MFKFIRLKLVSFSISAILSLASILAVIFIGLNLRIDFKGGILLEVRTSSNISIAKIRNEISNLNIGEISISRIWTRFRLFN